MSSDAARRHATAWLLLTIALALHVADEALTGFLDFYNPFVLSIRPVWSPFPPTFTFDVWLGGLALLVVILAAATPAVRRGAVATRAASWMFAGIMFLNGLAHLGSSVYFGRWMPGATTAPLLLAASAYLARATAERRAPSAQRPAPTARTPAARFAATRRGRPRRPPAGCAR